MEAQNHLKKQEMACPQLRYNYDYQKMWSMSERLITKILHLIVMATSNAMHNLIKSVKNGRKHYIFVQKGQIFWNINIEVELKC